MKGELSRQGNHTYEEWKQNYMKKLKKQKKPREKKKKKVLTSVN